MVLILLMLHWQSTSSLENGSRLFEIDSISDFMLSVYYTLLYDFQNQMD